jgi:methylated-DNA-[protein]-cysteine S-methyltransferase
MSQRIKYVIFETEWGYFGLAGINRTVFRSILPIKEDRKVKSLLLKGLEAKRYIYSKDYHKKLQRNISSYFKGSHVNFKVPISFEDLTIFQAAVLRACQNIKYGQIRSYGKVAIMAKHKKAARAVGGALSKNPVPLIIPCHRVTYTDGCIGGFSACGGIKVKEQMLKMEHEFFTDNILQL